MKKELNMKLDKRRSSSITINEEEANTVQEFNFTGVKENEFYYTYVQALSPILKLKQLRDIQVLSALCMMMQHDKNRVFLTPQRRQELLTLLNMKSTHFANCLKNLKNLGVITGDRGDYEVNPILFWKGSRESRNRLLETKGLEIRLKFKM